MSDLSGRLVRYLIWTPDGLSGADARQYIFFRVGAIVAAATHGIWTVVFALNANTGMALYNVVVAGLFLFSGWLWWRRRGPLWFLHALYLVEIPFHGMLGTLMTGAGTMFWLMTLVATIACLISSTFSWRTKALICTAITGICCLTGVIGLHVRPWAALPPEWVTVMFVNNVLSVASAVVMYLGLNQYMVQVTEERLQLEFDRAEGLLRNILPDPITLRLKDGERVIANEHRDVSVIFADIVDLTAASARLTPAQLVETLNQVFSEFDTLADRCGAEKIKTIGDAYMVVIGAPGPRGNHAAVAVDLAFGMLNAAAALSGHTHFPIRLRIGINSGPVVAGVIGKRKFAYDLWGDAVNVAARMESQGEPGRITITQATADLLPSGYSITPEGIRDLKGKGPMRIFSVTPSPP